MSTYLNYHGSFNWIQFPSMSHKLFNFYSALLNNCHVPCLSGCLPNGVWNDFVIKFTGVLTYERSCTSLDKIPSGSSTDQDIYLISTSHRRSITQSEWHSYLSSRKHLAYAWDRWKVKKLKNFYIYFSGFQNPNVHLNK